MFETAAEMDATAWSGLFYGIYCVFAGIGALRQPDVWRKVIEDVNGSPGLTMLASLAEMLIGVALYMANPWVPADLLSCILKVIGGLFVVEALMLAGFNDIYANFWLRNLNHMHRGWALFSLAQGAVLAAFAVSRFH